MNKSMVAVFTKREEREAMSLARLLTMGLCLSISLAAASIPAKAETHTAFASFHVQGPISTTQNPYQCLTESWGAVVNNCSYSVDLVFDTPISYNGNHNITLQDYWGSWPTGASFSCTAYADAGTGTGVTGSSVSFTAATESLTVSVDAATPGDSVQVICWNVPKGTGISNINWNP